jgi:hypothetical protein
VSHVTILRNSHMMKMRRVEQGFAGGAGMIVLLSSAYWL